MSVAMTHPHTKGIGKIAIFLFLVVAVLWLASDVLLLFFAGALLSIGLVWLSEQVKRFTPLSYHLSVAVVILSLVGLLALSIVLLAPDIAKQVEGLQESITMAVEQLRAKLSQYPWAQQITQLNPARVLEGRGVLTQATSAVSAVITFFSYVLIVLFVALYLTAEPSMYKNGFLALLKEQRRKGEKALHDANTTLRWWLLGRLISMTVIAVCTSLGLYILNVPLAITLGLLAGLLSFVPYIGPLLSALPAVLIGFTVSPITALYVVILFLGIQFVESYFLDPVIERKTVSLPPALTIVFQLLTGTLFGFLGILLAAPLFVLIIVLIRHTYLAPSPR